MMPRQNARSTPYSPDQPTDWGTEPGETGAALDELGNVGIIKVSDTDPGRHLTGLAWLDTSVPSSVVTRVINLITSDTTIDASYDAIEVDASAGPVIIFLPLASVLASQFDVKKIDTTANTVTLRPAGSDKFDDGPEAVITDYNENITFHSNLVGWKIT